MTPLEEAVAKVIEAITNSGPNPEYHYEVMGRHISEWPTLWKSLGELLNEYNNIKDK